MPSHAGDFTFLPSRFLSFQPSPLPSFRLVVAQFIERPVISRFAHHVSFFSPSFQSSTLPGSYWHSSLHALTCFSHF